MYTVSTTQKEYPEYLRSIPQSPSLLYCEGIMSVLDGPCVSVIGSRKLTSYASQILQMFVPTLVQAGLIIVSGLAYGADVLAHSIALKHEGKCVAVLGSGLNTIYPRVHKSISQTIVNSGGCLISEYPPDTEALPFHFPQRNRIISGLSKVTLVVQAGDKSGTLQTCYHALEQGRDVCVVLSDITREEYKGCYKLARQGAHIVTQPQDVLNLYRDVQLSLAPIPLKPALTGTLATLYDCILHGIVRTEQLLEIAQITPAQLQSGLSMLELDGYIIFQHSTWRIIS